MAEETKRQHTKAHETQWHLPLLASSRIVKFQLPFLLILGHTVTRKFEKGLPFYGCVVQEVLDNKEKQMQGNHEEEEGRGHAGLVLT